MATITKVEWDTKTKGRTVRFCAWWTDQQGKRRSKNFDTKGQARRHLDRVTIDKANGVHVADSQSITIAAAADHWLDVCETVGRDVGGEQHEPVEPSTLRMYRNHAEMHINPRIGTKRLNGFRKPDAKAFRAELVKAVSRELAKKILRSLHGIFAQAVADGLAADNPVAGITIRTKTRQDNKPAIPSRADMRACLKTADARARSDNKQLKKRWARYRAVAYTLTFSGLRMSELRGLPQEAVDLKAGAIEVYQRVDESGIVGRCKSKSAYRTIDIPDLLVAVLREWLVMCPPNPNRLVFPNWQGNVESLANLRQRFWNPLQVYAKVTDEDGKAKYDLHSIRHFFAASIIDAGYNPERVRKTMGHSSIQTTFDYYGHLFDQADSERRERVNSMAAKLL